MCCCWQLVDNLASWEPPASERADLPCADAHRHLQRPEVLVGGLDSASGSDN